MPKCLMCNTLPNFGEPGGTAIYCVTHKRDGDVDVVNKKCLMCTTQPNFGEPGGTAIYCVTHKRDGDVNLVNRKCLMCTTTASFGTPGGRRLYCAGHKRPGDVNVSKRFCLLCTAAATFGAPGGTRLYCAGHKRPGDVNVVDKTCLLCTRRPSFGVDGGTATYCVTHKRTGDVDLVSKRCLMCNIAASFGAPGGTRLYCVEHKRDGDVHLSTKTCQICCESQANPRYKDHAPEEHICARCFADKYPDHKVARAAAVKERLVAEFLSENLKGMRVEISFDRPIPGGSSKRRPDVLIRFEIDGVPYMLIVEIDEYQHVGYDPDDEDTRIKEMWRDGGEVGTIVIRFNPDAFTDIKGAAHTSCFGYDKNLRPRVRPSKTEVWAERLDRLLDEVRVALKKPPSKEVDVRYLFYNGFDPESTADVSLDVPDDAYFRVVGPAALLANEPGSPWFSCTHQIVCTPLGC
jgi:hypothetical protein